MQKLSCLTLLCAVIGATVSAQELDLSHAAVKSEASLTSAMLGLAKQAIAVYQEPDRSRYLNALFRLQIVAGQYPEAAATLRSLIELRQATDPASALPLLPFEMLAKARMKQTKSGLPLDEAFKQEFLETFNQMDNKRTSEALFWFGSDLSRARVDFLAALERQKGKDRIALLGDEYFKHLTLVVDGPPKVVRFAIDPHENLVEMPPPL